MKSVTATELGRNLSRILDDLSIHGGELQIVRHRRTLARLVAGSGRQTAREALADLYRVLPDGAGAAWERDARTASPRVPLVRAVRDPWRS